MLNIQVQILRAYRLLEELVVIVELIAVLFAEDILEVDLRIRVILELIGILSSLWRLLLVLCLLDVHIVAIVLASCLVSTGWVYQSIFILFKSLQSILEALIAQIVTLILLGDYLTGVSLILVGASLSLLLLDEPEHFISVGFDHGDDASLAVLIIVGISVSSLMLSIAFSILVVFCQLLSFDSVLGAPLILGRLLFAESRSNRLVA